MFPASDSNNAGGGETLENHATDLDFPVFDNPDPIISVQPQAGDIPLDTYPGGRRPIPVSTLDWQSTNESQFIPTHGLEFLAGAHQLCIQQKIELHDLLENVDSENRYVVKIPHGETLYYAAESSTNFQRMCCGSSRSFSLQLYDQTRQQAMTFNRRLAFGNCSFLCYLQVWTRPGELVGCVKQDLSMGTPRFSIYNRHGFVIYKIEGPEGCLCGILGKDAVFKLYTADNSTQVGSIMNQWDQISTDYYLTLQFPATADVKHKALLLGAAFLLEYMYFEQSRLVGCCRC